MYQGIAQAIEMDIIDGVLQPGDILPTHRELADKLGVAIGTVTKAYKEAETKSLIVGRGRRGTFVRSQDATESALSKAVDLWTCDDHPIYTLPYGSKIPDFNNILKSLLSRPVDNPHRYWPPESNRPEHQQTGVHWLARCGLEVSPEAVVPTMGNHHGLLVALANEATPGDTVVSENHTFTSLMPIAEFLHLKTVGLDADAEGLMPEAFEAECRRSRVRAVYCQPCVQNPTNASMSEVRRKAIVKIAQKYGVVLIEDEIARPIADDPPPLLRSLAPDHCYLLASPSKLLIPGIKIGYMVPPEGSMTALRNTIRATMAFMGGLPSIILDQMLANGTADKHISECRLEGRKRQDIARNNLPQDLVRTNPASYFVWLHLPEGWPAATFAAELYRMGIPAWPAENYCPDPQSAKRAVRFNIGQSPNQPAFQQAIKRVAQLLDTNPRHLADD